MSLVGSVANAAAMPGIGTLLVGAVVGAVLGPAAAATSTTVPTGAWPWQSGPSRWLLGGPATLRRRVLLSLSGGVVLGSLGAVIGWRPAMLGFLIMGFLGITLTVIDLEHHRLPDRLTLAGALGSAAMLVLDAMLLASWTAALRGLLCAAATFGVFLLMAVISPDGMGLGDVKLAALLGLHTGWLGWQLALLAVLAGFAVGSLAALGLMLARRATLRTAIPFGPALLVGAWLVVVAAGVTG